MRHILDMVESPDALGGDFADVALREAHRAAVLHQSERDLVTRVPMADRSATKSIHVQEVRTPSPEAGEGLIAVLAGAVNYNTVWSALGAPVSTFECRERYAHGGGPAARHDLEYHTIGSDLAGVVLRIGSGGRRWRPGDRVVAHCLSIELESADGHNDTMLDPEQRIWEYETNFGGLAEIALVKANQLMPKSEHLTWEEAACSGLAHSTAYRQLVSRNGADLKQGDNVLIWGASGGLGSYATQPVLAGGANPVCVVSNARKAELCRALGATAVIDRRAEGYRFWKDEHTQDPREWKRFGARIRELTGGEDVDVVFEHPGRDTFGASVFVARKGGTVVTCESTTGFIHHYDNRYLWMSLKRIVGSHFASYREAWEANRLIGKGKIHPALSKTYLLQDNGQATDDVHRNLHQGKIGVLALAPRPGLGVRDPELWARHLDAINLFREPDAQCGPDPDEMPGRFTERPTVVLTRHQAGKG